MGNSTPVPEVSQYLIQGTQTTIHVEYECMVINNVSYEFEDDDMVKEVPRILNFYRADGGVPSLEADVIDIYSSNLQVSSIIETYYWLVLRVRPKFNCK